MPWPNLPWHTLNKKKSSPIPRIACIWYLKKTALCENRINGTVLMIQLMRNSPTCTYIGQNPLMWKPRYAGTRYGVFAKNLLIVQFFDFWFIPSFFSFLLIFDEYISVTDLVFVRLLPVTSNPRVFIQN